MRAPHAIPLLLLGLASVLAASAKPGAGRSETAPPIIALRPLPSPAAPGSAEPHLAVSPDAEVWLGWLEPRARGGHALRVARLEGRRWVGARTVVEGDSFFANWADFPTVIPLGQGCLAAHWLWRSGPDAYAYDVRLSFSGDNGRTWTDPVTPHRDGTQTEHGFVSLLREGDGVRAVWLDGRNFASARADSGAAAHGEHGPEADMTLRTAVIHPDGSLSDEMFLDGRACECCQTAAVKIPLGVLVAYRDRSPDEMRDIALMRWVDGLWSEPYPLHADGWKIAGCPVNGPALDADGNLVAIAWYTAAADSPRVRLAFSSDGGRSFGPPIGVDGGDPLGRVDVALLADGSALACWLESIGQEARIMVRRVSRDGAVSAAETVAATSAKRASGLPRLVRSERRVIFAWTEAGKPSQVRLAEAAIHPR